MAQKAALLRADLVAHHRPEVMDRTLAAMKRRNVFGVVSGELLDDWRKAAPERIIPSLDLNFASGLRSLDSVRQAFTAGGYRVDAIEQAPFLNADQKRDILYNNAARFLKPSDQEVARHHGSKSSVVSHGDPARDPRGRPIAGGRSVRRRALSAAPPLRRDFAVRPS